MLFKEVCQQLVDLLQTLAVIIQEMHRFPFQAVSSADLSKFVQQMQANCLLLLEGKPVVYV
jgi:hypothetical protein